MWASSEDEDFYREVEIELVGLHVGARLLGPPGLTSPSIVVYHNIINSTMAALIISHRGF